MYIVESEMHTILSLDNIVPHLHHPDSRVLGKNDLWRRCGKNMDWFC